MILIAYTNQLHIARFIACKSTQVSCIPPRYAAKFQPWGKLLRHLHLACL